MKPYIPEKLPPTNLNLGRLVGQVGKANADLARYDGLLLGLVNPDLLLSPLTTQEAVLSSKIEGTVATLDEVLELEAGHTYDEEKTQDIQEIINYRQALIFATEQLAHRSLTLGLIKQMHQYLMASVRGQEKDPGRFRKDQNWIGRPGSPIEVASFVPPEPIRLLDHLEAWEKYLGYSESDILIQTAVVHAQFELIHPFKDGNGRIGRLLIPLFLFKKRILSSPNFYLSAYFETHRDEYNGKLAAISSQNDWSGWISFFLQAISVQAKDNADKVKSMMSLYEEMKQEITAVTHSRYSIQALDAFFDRPIFRTSDFVSLTSISRQTAIPLLRQLRGAGILTTIREASGRRPATLAFPRLLNIVEGRRIV